MSVYKQIVLKQYCDGPPNLEDFVMETGELPPVKEGRFRVRHVWCSVDPGTRSRLSGGDSYAAALPLGKPIDGFSVGVVEASQNEQFPDGTLVGVAGGWRTHSVQSGRGFVVPISAAASALPLSYWIGVLGVPGLTAWFGMKETARFKEGDTVLVTSAAGPVGATAGQLAKTWGAKRVVGVAGSDEKCAWLINEAGFDAAINYKTSNDLTAAIAAEFPDGIDVLFDNVGNEMVNRVIPLMNMFGRICISGQVADYNIEPDKRFGVFNTAQFITHRINMQGLVVFDFARQFGEALTSMSQLIASGELKLKEDRFEGIETMPEAFCGLFRGENFGRRVVRVGDDP